MSEGHGWLIEFAFEHVLYAGWLADGSLGYAPSIYSAAVFETREAADRTLANSYGPISQEAAQVVPAPPGSGGESR